MAYSDNFPTQRAVFTLDAANAGRLDPRCSFSRASTGTFFGTDKVLSSENLLLQSQAFDTTWGTGPGHLTGAPSGGQTAPDGTSTAFLATADTSGSSLTPYVNQTISLSASSTYTMVGHLKAGTATHAFISFRGSNGNSAYAMVNFSGGTVSHGSYGDFTSPSSSVTALGSSWYRVTLTATTGTSLSSQVAVIGISDGTAPSSAGYASYVPSGETIYLWGAQLSSTQTKVYDSPTTTQIAREYQTKLQTAASGAARFETATDGQSMGVLIESQATNLYANSSDMTGGSGALVNVDSNVGIAPDGTLTADALRLDSTDTNAHYREYYFTAAASTTYTFSVYLKSAGLSYVAVRSNNQFASNFTYFNLSNGTVEGSPAMTSTISSVGNGWHRATVTATTTGSGSASFIVYITDSSSSTTVATGDSYRAVLGTGVQVETGSFASSLISTSGATATRAADSLSMTDASLFDTGTGSLVVEAVVKSLNDGVAAWLGTDGNNYHQVGQFGSTTYPLISKADGVASAILSSSAVSTGAAHKVAASWATNDFAGCVDGGTVVTDTSGTLPAVNKLTVGNYNAAAAWLDGHVKRVAVYSEALSDTNLQALTS